MNEFVVSARQLSLVKNKQTLLRDISFGVKRGAICGLIGPSGAGKTTLMRVLVGLQAPLSGEVVVLDSTPGSRQNRKQVGYVTQSPSIYPDLTVTQNLQYFARLAGVKKKAAISALKKVHLTPQSDQLVATLSGGQRTRASLAVALLGDPELLIMDEPTVGLDPLLRRDLWELFVGMANEGKTMIISSHVMDEAAHCEQLLLLRQGELLWADSGEKLLRSTKAASVEEAFIRLVKGGQSS